MNWDQIEGNWKKIRGNIKQFRGRLADDQFLIIAGKRDSLAGEIQKSYGLAKEKVEQNLTAATDQKAKQTILNQ